MITRATRTIYLRRIIGIKTDKHYIQLIFQFDLTLGKLKFQIKVSTTSKAQF